MRLAEIRNWAAAADPAGTALLVSGGSAAPVPRCICPAGEITTRFAASPLPEVVP